MIKRLHFSAVLTQNCNKIRADVLGSNSVNSASPIITQTLQHFCFLIFFFRVSDLVLHATIYKGNIHILTDFTMCQIIVNFNEEVHMRLCGN